MHLILRGERVVLPDGVQPARIHVVDGRIAAIHATPDAARRQMLTTPPAPGSDTHEIDAHDLVVMPGLVDSHVHINDPGRAEWEGFEHATAAAAAGGITTLVDMPLNSVPPTTTLAGYEAKCRAARGHCAVDVALWGGVVPG